MMKKRRYLPVAAIAAVALVAAACGGGGDDDAMETSGMDMEQLMEPTPVEQLMAAEAGLTAAQMAVNNLAPDATPDEIGAAHAGLATARQALAAAENLPENLAASQMSDVAGLISAAQMLVDALTAMSSDEDVATANAAVMAAETALEGATALSSESMSSLGGEITALEMTVSTNDDARTAYMVMQARSSVNMAVASAQTAVGGLSSSSTAQERADAQALVDAAKAALDGVMNLPAAEVSALRLVVGSLDARITSVTADGMELVAAQRVSSLYLDVQRVRNDAGTAADDAAAAAKSAAANVGMLSTEAVFGESADAEKNADKVLNALNDPDTGASAAVTTAKATKTALEALDTEGIDAGHKTVLDQAIEGAMEYVDDQIAAAEANETTIKGHVATVEGTDADMPMTAADAGLAVAEEMLAALSDAPGTANENQLRTMVTDAPAPTMKNAEYMDNHKGKTWVELIGAGNIVDTRIISGNVTAAVKAASVGGMTMTSVSEQTVTPEDEFVDDGTQILDAMYKGITGTLFCQGATCRVEDAADTEVNTDRKFVGGWYFAPASSASERIYYVAASDTVGNYMVEETFARFGYWLTFADADADAATPNVPVLNRFATSADVADGGAWNTVGNTTNELEATATYIGPAVGMSAMKDSKGDATGSGSFTAKATLSASFGASATLGGSITEFDGAAANGGWIVTLPAVTFNGTTTLGAAIAVGSGPGGAGANGGWSATSYGGSDMARPAGIFGGFNAHFVDGDAAGVYNATK